MYKTKNRQIVVKATIFYNVKVRMVWASITMKCPLHLGAFIRIYRCHSAMYSTDNIVCNGRPLGLGPARSHFLLVFGGGVATCYVTVVPHNFLNFDDVTDIDVTSSDVTFSDLLYGS